MKNKNSADHTHLENPDRQQVMQTVNNFYDKNATSKSANNVTQAFKGTNNAYD